MKPLEKIRASAYSSNEELWEISEKAWDRYLQYMEDLSVILNSFHGTNHSVRYWKLTAGKWVQYFLGTLFTNYELAKSDDAIDESFFAVHNFSHGENFRDISFGDEMFLIIRQYITYYRNQYDKEMKKEDISESTEIKSERCLQAGDIGITDDFQYLMLMENWYEIKKEVGEDNVLESIPNEEFSFPYKYDIELRKHLFTDSYRDEFDFVFGYFVAWNLPYFYLESYRSVCECVDTYKPSKRFKRIFVADPTDYRSVVQDFFLADQFQKYGTEIVCVQHGGGYGMSPATTYFYDKEISDYFLTYGWGGESYFHVPNILLLRNPQVAYRENSRSVKRVLLISTLEMEHRVRPIGFSSSVGYRDDIFAFLSIMLKCSRIPLEWRTFAVRLSVAEDMKQQVLLRLGGLRTCLDVDLPGSAMQRIQQARIVVLDHLSTTVLETMGAGIPTVMFWNPLHTPLTHEAEEICNQLRHVGILHDTPEAAAQFVLKIYDSINIWWNSPSVYAVREIFNQHFSIPSINVLADYIALFTSQDEIGDICSCIGNGHYSLTKYSKIEEYKKKVFPHLDINSIDHLKAYHIYLFGAGEYGHKVEQILSEQGVMCAGFIDNALSLNGKCVNGIPVYSLSRYKKKYNKLEDIIVICIVNNEFSVKMQLIEEGIYCFVSMWQLAIL